MPDRQAFRLFQLTSLAMHAAPRFTIQKCEPELIFRYSARTNLRALWAKTKATRLTPGISVILKSKQEARTKRTGNKWQRYTQILASTDRRLPQLESAKREIRSLSTARVAIEGGIKGPYSVLTTTFEQTIGACEAEE